MLWYLVRCGVSILIGFIIWVAAAQLGSFIFRGTSMEDVMILVAVLGWVLYVFSSKKMTAHFTPAEISSTTIIFSFLAALLFSIPIIF